MYQKSHLVHADLSEYNVLYHEKVNTCWIELRAQTPLLCLFSQFVLWWLLTALDSCEILITRTYPIICTHEWCSASLSMVVVEVDRGRTHPRQYVDGNVG